MHEIERRTRTSALKIKKASGFGAQRTSEQRVVRTSWRGRLKSASLGVNCLLEQGTTTADEHLIVARSWTSCWGAVLAAPPGDKRLRRQVRTSTRSRDRVLEHAGRYRSGAGAEGLRPPIGDPPHGIETSDQLDPRHVHFRTCPEVASISRCGTSEAPVPLITVSQVMNPRAFPPTLPPFQRRRGTSQLTQGVRGEGDHSRPLSANGR